jgi:quercetin 2,3-dioxygenase
MTAAMMTMRPSASSSSIYTRIRTGTHRLTSQLQKRTSTITTKLLPILLLVFFLIPTAFFLLPAARTMSSSSSNSDAVVSAFQKPRVVVKKVLAESQPEGQGATVRRSIGRCAAASFFYLPFPPTLCWIPIFPPPRADGCSR